MATSEGFAPAKINLTLHVTGQRADGYHLLDSLVVFADIGDRVRVAAADAPTLAVDGPMAAGVPTDGRNLVLRAATLMGVTAEIHLEKHLPAAAGIGGGSSDAAATLRALARLTGRPLPNPADLLRLGADVPLCLSPEMTRMGGIGEQLQRLGPAPALPLVLVNPGVAVRTPAVFAALERKDNPPMTEPMPDPSAPGWMAWLAAQRNDLEPPAITQAPVIADVLAALRARAGCRLARMSGSGATCFAIMDSSAARDAAVAALRQAHPGWWVAGCATL